MYDNGLYVAALTEFTRVLLAPYDVERVCAELTDRVTDLLGLTGSAVSLAAGDRLKLTTAYGREVAEVDKVQARVQVGPCVTAFRTGQVVAVGDLPGQQHRWPEYCATAARWGIRSVASIPMTMDHQTVGVLALYARGPRQWPAADVAAVMVLANMAAASVINTNRHGKQVDLTEDLQRALDSRILIEQAKGLLAGRHDISPDEAFERLRDHARRHRAPLHTIAQAVLHHRLEL